MKLWDSWKTCTRCFGGTSLSMLLQRSTLGASLKDFAGKTRKKFRCEANEARTSQHYEPAPSLLIVIVLSMFLQSVAYGQNAFGYRDLLDPDKLTSAQLPRSKPADPLTKLRSLTTRAIITVHGRSQSRHLTVFRASSRGHVEFGFPTVENRPTGSLEIFDGTMISSDCCPQGIRMVALRHICSDSFLAVDAYGQTRACQLSADGSFIPLRRERHCLDGERMHTCTESPYFYLDSVSKMGSQNPVLSPKSGQPGQYKIRFERKTPQSEAKKVLYAAVTSAAWEFKLREQNSFVRRATTDACQALWPRVVNALFRRTIADYVTRRVKRNFRDFQRLCHISPLVVRDYILNNVTSNQFSQAVENIWKSNQMVEFVASSVAWSKMKDAHKNVFVVVAAKVAKDFLRDSLLEVTNLYCLRKTQWGRMSRETKLRRLNGSLTISWIQKKTAATSLVVGRMERYINSRTTTFVIREEG